MDNWKGNQLSSDEALDVLKKSIPGEASAIDDLIFSANEHFKIHGYPTAIEGIDDDPEYSAEWITQNQ